MNGIKVLSLFDGLGGARQALKDAKIEIQKYYASEIDKYAISVCCANHPDVIQLGSVVDLLPERVGQIDLLIGGSPCQDLSIAKKGRTGLKGDKSGLFWHYVRLLETLNPKYFFLENVASMKNVERDKISEILGVEPIIINSALLTAQQRKRYYWTNIPNVQQPEDKHIYLKNILESGDTEKLKSYCIDANYWKGASLEQYLTKCRRQLVFDSPDRIGQIGNGGQGDRIYSTNGKSISLSANGGGRGAKTGLYLEPFCLASRGRHLVYGKRKDILGAKTTQILEPRFDGKTNCLTTVQKDNYILQNYTVRKLTPIECERLQGLPDNYTKMGVNSETISNTQRYRMLGNGFTIPVIEHILSFMEL